MKQTDAAFVPNALKLIEHAIHLLRRNSIPIKDALSVVNARSLTKKDSDKDEEPPSFG